MVSDKLSILIFFFSCTLVLSPATIVNADGIPMEAEGSKVEMNSEAGDKKSSAVKSVKENAINAKKSSYSLSEEVLAKYQYCGKDSDCMEVINGCCQCLQGDKYVAIAKNRYEDFKKNFACDNVLCPKEENSRNCMEGVISCVSHKCNYFQP